jgi:chaperonin GroES
VKKPTGGKPSSEPSSKSSSRGASAAGSKPTAAPPAREKAAAPVAASSPSPGSSGGRKGISSVRPLRDRVLVKRIEESEQKVGGIIVPDTAKEKPQQAEVIAVGSGRILDNGQREPLAVKAGDKVLVGKWSGTDVRIDGIDYLILKEDEILGILA